VTYTPAVRGLEGSCKLKVVVATRAQRFGGLGRDIEGGTDGRIIVLSLVPDVLNTFVETGAFGLRLCVPTTSQGKRAQSHMQVPVNGCLRRPQIRCLSDESSSSRETRRFSYAFER
jgi:hypothetical protein